MFSPYKPIQIGCSHCTGIDILGKVTRENSATSHKAYLTMKMQLLETGPLCCHFPLNILTTDLNNPEVIGRYSRYELDP